MDLQTRIPISNGTSIPCVGFGTWKTPDEEAAKSVEAAASAWKLASTFSCGGTG